MKIKGLEFTDWLHKIRKESEAERKRRKLSGEDWLKETEKRSAEIIRHLNAKKKIPKLIHS